MGNRIRGIVLRILPYKDHIAIISLYTYEKGMQSFLYKRENTKSFFSPRPLYEIEFEEIHKLSRKMNFIQKISVLQNNIHIHTHPIKVQIVAFLSELLYRLLQDTSSDPDLYLYISKKIVFLEQAKERAIANFHLCFIFHLLKQMGVEPTFPFDKKESNYFDLLEAKFTRIHPGHSLTIESEKIPAFLMFMRMNFENSSYFRYNRNERREILFYLLNYLKIHIKDIKQIISIDYFSFTR